MNDEKSCKTKMIWNSVKAYKKITKYTQMYLASKKLLPVCSASSIITQLMYSYIKLA